MTTEAEMEQVQSSEAGDPASESVLPSRSATEPIGSPAARSESGGKELADFSTDDRFIQALFSVATRFPYKSLTSAASIAAIFAGIVWGAAKHIEPPTGQRETAALEAAYRDHGIPVPSEGDLVSLIDEFSRRVKARRRHPAEALEIPATVKLETNTRDSGEGTTEIFEHGNPFPLGFDLVKPGDRLSVAKAIMESGELRPNHVSVPITSGTFKSLLYVFDPDEAEDPAIRVIFFTFRDNQSANIVKAAAAVAFREFEVKALALGASLEWPDVNGYKVSWTSYQYAIQR